MSAAAAASAFASEGAERYPSFQETPQGPGGTQLHQHLTKSAAMNVPFDQLQFEEAKQNGCLPAPCKAYPSWPPPYGTGFIYPSIQKADPGPPLGTERGCFPMASPFVDTEPILPSVNVKESYGDRQYSPSEILGMYDCLNTPQPLSNKCFGYMPYDATYMAATMSRGGQAQGWLDNPDSPVPITSVHQPVAVGTDIPSQVPAEGHENDQERRPSKETFVSGVRPVPVTRPQLTQPQYTPPPPPPSVPQPRLVPDEMIVVVPELPDSSPRNESHIDDGCRLNNCADLLPCTHKTLRGFLYDLTHPDNQPDDEDSVSWIFRNHRPYFLGLLVLVLLGFHFILRAGCGPDAAPVTALYWLAVLAYVIYMALPPTHGPDEAQKITSLFILTVVLWSFWCKYTQ